MSVFVVTVEGEETSIVGVYFSEKEGKAAAVGYTKDQETKFKRNAKNDEEETNKTVLFVENTKETRVCMTKVECVLPVTKKTKDPNAPKKNMSAYMFYAVENRPKIKEKNPDATFNDLSKLVGESWKKLTDKQKKPYNDKSEADKLRYAAAAKEYTETVQETN